jgi:hypothetical protein
VVAECSAVFLARDVVAVEHAGLSTLQDTIDQIKQTLIDAGFDQW